MLSPEQAAKLREKLFGPGFGLPTMGAGMPAPIVGPPMAPAPPPPAPGLGGMTGVLLKAGETIEAKKDADEAAAAAAAAKGTFALPGPSLSNGANTGPTVGTPGASLGGRTDVAALGNTVPSLVDLTNGAPAKPMPAPLPAPPVANGGKPSLGALTDKMIANPMYAKVMAKLDAKGYGGGPGAGGGAPKGPAPDLRHRMYTPGEIAQQDATLGYLDKSGKLDEQAADLAAHGELQKAVLERNAAEEAEQMAAERDAKEKERLDYVQGQISLHDQQADALAQQKIDPDRFWKSKGDGAKVGAMIAMFFGGFGSGEQSAMILKNIQGKIDADVDAQKTNIAQGWKGLAEKKGIFAERLAAFGDERMAEASSKAEYWQGISLTASAHAAETASEMEKVNAQKLAEAAAFKADSFKNEIQIGAEKKWELLEKQKAAAAAAAAVELKKQNIEDRKALMQVAVMDIEANGGKLAFDPSGAPGIIRNGQFVPATGKSAATGAAASATIFGAPNAKGQVPVAGNAPAKSAAAGEKLDALGQNYADAMALLNDFDNHIDNVGTTINPWGNAADLSDELQSKLFGKIKGMAAAKGGSPGSSEEDAKKLMKQVPTPGALFGDQAKARIAKLREDLTNEYENGKKAMLSPAAQPSNPLQLGKPVP